ncbi:MAG TPA: WYL domain-containing protein [Gemmatimonadales bacterium]|nr:WYL domain-containing protein [Gemmatimonadales bacterium]
METAAAQLKRILHVIPTLADDQDHPIEEVARLAGVDRKTIVKDLRSVAERFDDPGGFVEGVAILIDPECVSVRTDHFHRPMRLTRRELAALELGLAMIRGERPPDEHRAIDNARKRLGAVVAELPEDADRVPGEGRLGLPLIAAGEDPSHRALLRSAIEESLKVRIAYQKADAREPSPRTACPHALVHASGMWYLVAHCDESGLRFFRLDRVHRVDVLDEKFERSDDGAAEELPSGPMFRAEAAGTVTIRYSPTIARWIAERAGKELDAQGGLTLEHPCADADWAVRHVLQYGPDAEVLEPAEIRAAVRTRLAMMASS